MADAQKKQKKQNKQANKQRIQTLTQCALYVCPFSYRSTCIASAWLAGSRLSAPGRR
jgi:hypothetical protein